MPVDDLLAWAAETSYSNARRPRNEVERSTADELASASEFRSIVGRPPSPGPGRDRLPKWYGELTNPPWCPLFWKWLFLTSSRTDIGHCPAACSYRCSLHVGQQEPQDASVADPLHKPQRHHRRSSRPRFQREDNQSSRVGSNSKQKRSEYWNSRLDRAREELLIGNVHVARKIVAEELERITRSEGK
jgi:hypothetical protein